LLFTTAECVWHRLQVLLQSHVGEQLPGSFAAGLAPSGGHTKKDISKYAEVWEESVVLENKSYWSVFCQLVLGGIRDNSITDGDGSVVLPQKSRDDSEESGFSAARRAQQAMDFSWGNRQCHVTNGFHLAKAMGDILYFEAHLIGHCLLPVAEADPVAVR